MSEFLEDPSVLTKDKLKNELLANNVALPSGEHKKEVYVQLYLKKLTAQNKRNPAPDAFSSDEDLPPPVVSNKSRSGRKATRKTDKPRPDDVDVADLTDEGLKDQLLKYGINPGPIVASTRKLYEKKLQKLLDQGPPEATVLTAALPKADGNQNGNTDSDQYSDKEEEEQPAPEPEPEPVPEPVPVVERPLRSRGKTPVSVRANRHGANRYDLVHQDVEEEEWWPPEQEEEQPPLNVKRRLRQPPHWRDQTVPASDDTDMSESSASEIVARPCKVLSPRPHNQDFPHKCDGEESRALATPVKGQLQCLLNTALLEDGLQDGHPCLDVQYVGKQRKASLALTVVTPERPYTGLCTPVGRTPKRVEEKPTEDEPTPAVDGRDLLKEMFPNEVRTPTGISATCRRPIRGAAGRPLKPSDFWMDESLLRRTERLESRSYTESRSTPCLVASSSSSSRLAAALPPGQAHARRSLPVWVQLLLLSAVAGFLFFVYQAMETNQLNPFGDGGVATASSTGGGSAD